MVTNPACRALLRCVHKKLIPPPFPSPACFRQRPCRWSIHGSYKGWRQQSSTSSPSSKDDRLERFEAFAKVQEVHTLLETLESAADRWDVASVWATCESLSAKGFVHNFGHIVTSKIHNIIDKELCKEVSEVGPEKLETLSIVCAVNGNSNALRRVMLEHLKKGNAPSAINVYSKFKSMSTGNSQSATADSDGMNLVDKSRGSIGADLVALVVSAHAYCDTFEDALHTVLQDPSPRLSTYRTNKIADEIDFPQEVRERFLKYTSALEVASLVSKPDAFRARVRTLMEPRNEEQLTKICLHLAAGFDGDLAWATSNESQVSRSRPVLVRDIIWASLIRALVICRFDELAGRLWSKMTALGITPTVAVWHALLDGYRETHQFARLLSAWNSMIQPGIKPDAALHCSRILALFDSGSKTQAVSAFEEFKTVMKGIPGGALVVFNATIRGLLKAHDFDGAHALLKSMPDAHLKPDIVTFNTFLQHYAKKGDMQSVLSTIRNISEAGLGPDVVTFTTLHVALLKAGHAKATEGLLEVMKQMGIEPNVATYSAMIDQYVKDGTSEGIHLGRELLDKMEMERTPFARPNEITYTSFLLGLHRNENLSQEEVADTTEEILQRMERRGIRVKLGMYHILLKGALSSSRPDDGLAAFQNYYRMMLKKKIKFAHDTWYIILSGLIRRNEWGLAKVMVDDMLRSGFEPMWGVQDMVRSILQRQSTSNSPSSRRGAMRRPFV